MKNNSFASSWSGSSNLTASDIVRDNTQKYGTHSIVLTPEGKQSKEITQTIPITGSEEDTYVLSGWVNGKITASNGNDNARRGDITVTVTYEDDTTVRKGVVSFNTSIVGWKYAAGTFNLSDGNSSTDKKAKSLTISLRSYHQGNSLYFDGIQLNRKKVEVYSYDSNGNLSSDGKKKYTYSDDRVLTETDGIDTKFTYGYDTKGNVIQITNDINDIISKYTYDSHGNQLSSITENSETEEKIITENVYDESDAYLNEKKDADGYSTLFSYDTAKGLLSSITDAQGNETVYGYDSQDRLITVTKGNKQIAYAYDQVHDALSQLDSETTGYSFTYDAFGNRIDTKIAGSTVSTNTYKNYNGDLARVTLADGTYYDYAYDEYGNTIQIRKNGAIIKSYQYDREGTLLSMSDATRNIRIKYDYDLAGNIIRVDSYDMTKTGMSDAWLCGIEYGYDEHDRLIRKNTRTKDATRSNAITYKEGSLIDSYQIDSSRTITYGYDSLNRLTSKSIDTGTPISIQYAYADSATREGATTSRIATETIGGLTYTYSYDTLGNITQITAGEESVRYEYDADSQLTREDNSFLDRTITYSYDSGGNITSRKEYAYTTGSLEGNTYNETSYGYATQGWKDQLTSYNGQTITYDEIGNPTSYRGNELEWDGRQLISYVNADDNISFTYSSEGYRSSKSVNNNTTDYTYLDGKLIEEDGENGKLCYTYDEKGNLSKISHITSTSSNEYYIACNSRGDVEAIYDTDGALVARYIYDAWGNTTVVDSNGSPITSNTHIANINPIRYRGYYYDSETGLYYVLSRYYDPEVGRWINADDTENLAVDGSILSYNLFTYCLNNPVNRFDADGNWSLPNWAKIAIGTVVITTAAALTIATAGSSTALACFAVGALKGSVIGAATGALSGTVTEVVSNRITTGSWDGTLNAAMNGAADGFMTGSISGFIGGGLSSRVCFVAGTSVLTAFGMTVIEEIKAGDYVWASDPETREVGLKQVMQTFVNETDELMHVQVDGEEIICTNEHPFYSPLKGWTAACDLRAGDILVSVNGEYVVVEFVQHEILESPVTVYNFEVEDFHTYFIGECNVLVHNLCSKRAAMRAAKRSVNIPMSQNPDNVMFVKMIGENGRTAFAQLEIYGNKFIRNDLAGHLFKDGATLGRHFNAGIIDSAKRFIQISEHFWY